MTVTSSSGDGTRPASAAELTAVPPSGPVTRFPWRPVELDPSDGTVRRLALITMDNGADRPTTLGAQALVHLGESLDQVEAGVAAGELHAVAVTGTPPVFCVGADLRDVARISTLEAALGIARLGHDVLRRLGELGVPTFAFVNGPALGGGLEVALHCTHRTVSAAAGQLALPETSLGLVPGWGGTHLLPHLIGVQRALQVVVDGPLAGRTLTPAAALELGVVDALLEPGDFLEESLRWAGRVLAGEVVVERAPVDTEAAAWDAAVDAAHARVEARLHGAAPAAYRALELVRRARTDDRDAGFAAEDAALAELLLTDEFRAGVHSFDLTQRRAKRPAGAPDASLARPVSAVGVVGAGLMASQLALLFARRLRVPVTMTDLDAERVERGVAWVHDRIDDELRGLVTGVVSAGEGHAEAFAGADVVIEAVFEELAVKQAVLTALEDVVPEGCVLMTNTSSLSVTQMASVLRHPERVVGFHFFNPVDRLPLVEVVRTRGEHPTDDATLATAFAVGTQLRKSCVLVQDATAFVVNRLLLRFMGEVLAAVDEGTALGVADGATAPLGLPMTPLALLQLVGPAVALHVAESLHASFPDRFGVSPSLRRIVEAGLPGYLVPGDRGGEGARVAPEAAALLQVGDRPSSAEQVRTRVVEALAVEARLLLDEGVVADPRDVDLCLLLGAGWPFHLGGLLPHLDRSGVAERVTGRRFYPPGVASLP